MAPSETVGPEILCSTILKRADVAKADNQAFYKEAVIWEMDESNEVCVLNPELLDKIKVRGKSVARVRED